ncbi:hypothetical protein ES703_02582 [subsurface metagenome]
MKNKELVGTWKFVSMKVQTSSGELIYPYGENLFGMIIYTSGGYMSVLLMRPDRPRFASGDLLGGTPEEIKAAYEGFDAYCGTYEVDSEKGTVTHHIEGGKFPNWVGTDQERNFKFSSSNLVLTATIPVKGEQWNFEGVLEQGDSRGQVSTFNIIQ